AKNAEEAQREQQRQYWFDQRYGIAYSIKGQDSWGIQTFTPPTIGRGNDWLLALTNAVAGFSLPGATQ
ncbi:MAG: putative collagen-binding domain-containing protein, partial [Blastocatellia bacterium]